MIEGKERYPTDRKKFCYFKDKSQSQSISTMKLVGIKQ